MKKAIILFCISIIFISCSKSYKYPHEFWGIELGTSQEDVTGILIQREAEIDDTVIKKDKNSVTIVLRSLIWNGDSYVTPMLFFKNGEYSGGQYKLYKLQKMAAWHKFDSLTAFYNKNYCKAYLSKKDEDYSENAWRIKNADGSRDCFILLRVEEMFDKYGNLMQAVILADKKEAKEIEDMFN